MKGHYGIDPRKVGVVRPASGITSSRSISSVKKYNPYAQAQLVNPQTNLPPKNDLKTRSALGFRLKKEVSANKIIDYIFEQSKVYNVFAALEKGLRQYLSSQSVYVWLDNPTRNVLQCNTQMKSTPYNKSIVGFSFTSKQLISSPKPTLNDHYDRTIDNSFDQILCQPLFDRENNAIGVIQCGRTFNEPAFAISDYDRITEFVTKFKVYARLLLPSNADPLFTANLATINSNNNPYSKLISRLKSHFACRSVDVFCYTIDTETTSQFNCATCEFIPGLAGLSLYSLKTGIPINVCDSTQCSDYNESIDGSKSESVLVEPIVTSDAVFAFTLRGSHKGAFSAADEALMFAITPIIYRIISSENNFDDENNALSERLRALLEVAEILSGVLDIDTLVPTIMDRACSLLHTERCSLFLVDIDKQELVTRFHGGLDRSIRLPLSRGIVGHTATTGNVVNIEDAYADARFDQSVDRKTGYRTRNLLCVPIFNNRGEIAGVTEMINKIDDGPFNEDDIKMLMAFNVFCGISLDNARLYMASLNLSRQLRSFVQMSTSLNKSKSVEDIIEQILAGARQIIHAQRATVFLIDTATHNMETFVSVGEPLRHGTTFAEMMPITMQTTIYDPETVIEMTSENGVGSKPTSLKDTKGQATSASRVSMMLSQSAMSTESLKSVSAGESICTFPLKATRGLIGVLELSSTSRVLTEDTKLIECFAAFTAVSLERSELKDTAMMGSVDKKMKEWVSKDERPAFQIPIKLRIDPSKVDIIWTRRFDAPEWDGIGLFQVVFTIFNDFGLLEQFDISNEKFFKFIQEISDTYKKVPYHNWRHAVDVTQFVTYQLKLSGLDKKLTKFELLGLLVSCICHDANHDGFTNVYNVKAETPLGILFKNQSVMETHHCAVAIQVISKEECNIFASLSPDEDKMMWNMIIALILSTDMARHFTFLKDVGARLDQGPLDFSNADDRFMAMNLVLKCGDISNVSRPFELADKWCDVLCEEFFRQGDLEQANGMEYTSDLNDREHLNKPKSQIGFYTFVCLPLFQAAARAMPELQENVKQIESNLAVWKERTAQEEKK